MTALEYMEKQLMRHKANYVRESDRYAPDRVLNDIQLKIGYYDESVEALRFISKIKEIKKEN